MPGQAERAAQPDLVGRVGQPLDLNGVFVALQQPERGEGPGMEADEQLQRAAEQQAQQDELIETLQSSASLKRQPWLGRRRSAQAAAREQLGGRNE